MLVLALTVFAARGVLGGQPAQAQSGDCGDGEACVMLIEIPGLEAADVTREKTPNLWSLAHPGESLGLALPGRTGFIWEAPRATMTASPAAASVSLLTGGFARESGVPADHYDHYEIGTVRLGGSSGGRFPEVAQIEPEIDTLAGLIADQAEGGDGMERVLAAIGDPEIGRMLASDFNSVRRYFPTGQEGDPSLCPIPEEPPSSPASDGDGPPMPMQGHACAVPDMETLNGTNGAAAMLTGGAGANVRFSYIHLAELGKRKQRGADVDAALVSTDAALGTFFQRLQQQWGPQGQRFNDAVIFVVGGHGYEETTLAHRVPHPTAAQTDPWQDLQTYVERDLLDSENPARDVDLYPQGTVATVYVGGGTDEQQQASRDEIYDKLSPEKDNEVNQHALCGGVVPGTGLALIDEQINLEDQCILEVLYMSPELIADNDPLRKSVEEVHPTWRLDHLDVNDDDCETEDDGSLGENCLRTGSSGDLLIVMGKGWAAGRAVTSPFQATLVPPADPISNPYPFSSGGPRNRAIAGLVNGPSGIVKQLEPQPANVTTHPPGHPERVERLPVTNGPAQGDVTRDADNARYRTTIGDLLLDPTPSVERANTPDHESGRVIDDDGHEGHEFQPRTVDFPVTIAALMKIGMPPQTISETRILQEAFIPRLSLPFEEEDLGEPLPDDTPIIDTRPAPPARPAQPIIIQPPDEHVFDFEGLIRKVTARVTDRHGRSVSELRGLARLNHVEIRADFGRPQSQVHLTLYRRVRVGGSRRTRLSPIVRFEPFEVERGEQVRLRFRLPSRFRASYIGIAAREAVGEADDVRAIGPMDGGIVRLRDANRLHRIVAGAAAFTRVERAARAYDFWLRSHRFASRALERFARRGRPPQDLLERHERASELRATRRRELGSAVTELQLEMRRWFRQGRFASSLVRKRTRSIDRVRAQGRRPALRHLRERRQARTILQLRNGQLIRGHVLLRRLQSHFGRR